MKFLGLIPARAGSKGVKNKNTVLIKNKKLIEYTFDAGIKSKLLKKIIVSTNCKKVMNLKKKYKNIKFLQRSEYLSRDNSSIFDVIKDTIQREKKENNYYDYVVLLQPTTPLKNYKIIDRGIRKITKEKGNSLISVYQVDDNHPARMYNIKSKTLKPIFRNEQYKNRQKLEKIYHRDGNIYIFHTSNFDKNKKNYFGNKIIPLVLSRDYKLNIDNYLDLKIAKILL